MFFNRHASIFVGGEFMETLISLVGSPPVGFEVLEYIFKTQVAMVFMGLAIYIVVELIIGLVNMAR